MPKFSVEHLPDWNLHTGKKSCYHRFYENDRLLAVATVQETMGKLARIQFGPLMLYREVFAEVVNILASHYQKKGFWDLYIQTNEKASLDLKPIHLPFKSSFDIQSWSTILVDLSADNLLHTYSIHHQRQIKKAQKLGLECKPLDKKDLDSFAKGYCEMYAKRGNKIDEGNYRQTIHNRFGIVVENQNPYFYGVYHEGKLVGGLFMVDQGDNLYYFQGYADVHYRHLPVLHYGFFVVAEIAQKSGFKYLDLGGYNRFVDAKDQVYNINKFKLGFSENIKDGQAQIVFEFSPFALQMVSLLKRLKNLF